MSKNISLILSFLSILIVATYSLNARTLTLDECLKLGEENNLSIKSSNLSIESSENSVNSALSDFYDVTASAYISPSISDDYDTDTDLSKINIANGTLSAVGNLSLGLIDNYKYSKMSLENTKLSHQKALIDLRYNITNSFFTCIVYKEDLKVKEKIIDYSKLQYEQTKLRYDIGSLTKSDLLASEVELSRDSLSIIGALSTLNLKKQELINLLNININFEELELEYKESNDSIDEEFVLEDLIKEALQNRLDIKISTKNLDLATLNYNKNYNTYYPSLSANLSTSITRSDIFTTVPSTDMTTKDIKAGLSLNWNLSLSEFDNFNRDKVTVKQNEVSLDLKKQSVINEVKRTYLNLINERESLKRLDKHIELAKQNLELAEEMFKIGNRSIIEQIKAKNDYIDAEVNKIRSKYLYKIAVSNMYKTIGK